MFIEVTAAIILSEGGKYLIAKRKQGSHLEGLWEFPGGKLEEGESKEDCLQREILEELGLTIKVKAPFMTVEHSYGDKNIRLHSFLCDFETGVAVLNDHDEIAWITAAEFERYEFAPADIPIAARISEDYTAALR